MAELEVAKFQTFSMSLLFQCLGNGVFSQFHNSTVQNVQVRKFYTFHNTYCKIEATSLESFFENFELLKVLDLQHSLHLLRCRPTCSLKMFKLYLYTSSKCSMVHWKAIIFGNLESKAYQRRFINSTECVIISSLTMMGRNEEWRFMHMTNLSLLEELSLVKVNN